MTDTPPSPEALEAAVNFLWPHYTDKKVKRILFAAGSLKCHHFARALDAFAAAAVKRELEWRPIETAPRDDHHVDVWQKVNQRVSLLYEQRVPNAIFDNGQWTSDDSGELLEWKEGGAHGRAAVITHWRPLPAPPKVIVS